MYETISLVQLFQLFFWQLSYDQLCESQIPGRNDSKTEEFEPSDISLFTLFFIFALVVIHFQLTDCFEGKEGGVVKLEWQREKRWYYDR